MELTETKLNDILQEMWMHDIKIPSELQLERTTYNELVSKLTDGIVTDRGFLYNSDFGDILLWH